MCQSKALKAMVVCGLHEEYETLVLIKRHKFREDNDVIILTNRHQNETTKTSMTM